MYIHYIFIILYLPSIHFYPPTHTIHQCLLNIYYVPGIVAGIKSYLKGTKTLKKTRSLSFLSEVILNILTEESEPECNLFTALL